MAALSSLTDREQKLYDLQEEIEILLELVAATAIEDKLQDEVGPTIATLKETGIKVWVLTGDKIETAINIGYACQLLNDSLEKVMLDGNNKEEVEIALWNGKQQVNEIEILLFLLCFLNQDSKIQRKSIKLQFCIDCFRRCPNFRYER